MNKLSNNKGFTLIETVISLGVLSIGILALFAMQTLGIKANAKASQVTTLATWGSDEIEQILTDKYSTIVSTGFLDVPGYGDKYAVQKTISLDTPVKNIKTIDVLVKSKIDGKVLALKYLKANENP